MSASEDRNAETDIMRKIRLDKPVGDVMIASGVAPRPTRQKARTGLFIFGKL